MKTINDPHSDQSFFSNKVVALKLRQINDRFIIVPTKDHSKNHTHLLTHSLLAHRKSQISQLCLLHFTRDKTLDISITYDPWSHWLNIQVL